MSVAACLTALRQRSDELIRVIASLSPAAWQGETNCPPWRVHDLAAHLASSGEGFVASIQRGLAGDVEPPARSSRQADLAAAEPPVVAAALSNVTDAFEALYAGRSDEELETICWHRRGNRSMRWYAAHRLAEVAFHGWDLETSLGQSPRFDQATARLLLPTLLESNVPRTYAAGLSAERGAGERYLLQVADAPDLAWLVTIGPDALEVERRADLPQLNDGVTLVVTAAASDLALLVYGRADLGSVADLRGSRELAQRFDRVFPRP